MMASQITRAISEKREISAAAGAGSPGPLHPTPICPLPASRRTTSGIRSRGLKVAPQTSQARGADGKRRRCRARALWRGYSALAATGEALRTAPDLLDADRPPAMSTGPRTAPRLEIEPDLPLGGGSAPQSSVSKLKIFRVGPSTHFWPNGDIVAVRSVALKAA